MEIGKLTPVVQFVTATFAVVVGGYTAGDKFGWFDKAIIAWAPEHFKIAPAKIGEPIMVTVARIKKRDDCSVEGFIPSIRDASGMVHEAMPSMSKFSGPASKDIDTFTYELTMKSKERIAPGTATLLGSIKYKCPEGERTVQYPKHENLTFALETK